MTDFQTLSRLAEQSRRDTNLTESARAEYQKLTERFPEDGFEIELLYQHGADTEEQEKALFLLEKQGYLRYSFKHLGSDGFAYFKEQMEVCKSLIIENRCPHFITSEGFCNCPVLTCELRAARTVPQSTMTLCLSFCRIREMSMLYILNTVIPSKIGTIASSNFRKPSFSGNQRPLIDLPDSSLSWSSDVSNQSSSSSILTIRSYASEFQ